MPQPPDDPTQRSSPTDAMLRSLSLASSRGLARTTTLGQQNADATQARLDAASAVDESAPPPPDPAHAAPDTAPRDTAGATPGTTADTTAPPDPPRLPLLTSQPSQRLEHELRVTGARLQRRGAHAMYARLGATTVVWVAWAAVLLTLLLRADVADDNVLFAIVALSATVAIATLFIWIGDMRRAGRRRARLRRREHRRLHRDDESPGTTPAH